MTVSVSGQKLRISGFLQLEPARLSSSGASFEGGWGAVAPPQGKRKKEGKKKKRKKNRKKEERKKRAMNNVKLLHIKYCFFQFFNSPDDGSTPLQ